MCTCFVFAYMCACVRICIVYVYYIMRMFWGYLLSHTNNCVRIDTGVSVLTQGCLYHTGVSVSHRGVCITQGCLYHIGVSVSHNLSRVSVSHRGVCRAVPRLYGLFILIVNMPIPYFSRFEYVCTFVTTIYVCSKYHICIMPHICGNTHW